MNAVSKMSAEELHDMKLMVPGSSNLEECSPQKVIDEDELNDLLNGGGKDYV